MEMDCNLKKVGQLQWRIQTLSAIFPSVISSFFTQNKGGGGAGAPGPSPRSATELF